MATRWFATPNNHVAEALRRKKDHGLAEALLIAAHGYWAEGGSVDLTSCVRLDITMTEVRRAAGRRPPHHRLVPKPICTPNSDLLLVCGAPKTGIYSDFTLGSIQFSCSGKLWCHPDTQISPLHAREGVARVAPTPGADATGESESSTTRFTFSPKFIAFGGATQPPRSLERAHPSVSL